MAKYKTKIGMPETLQAVLQEIQAVGAVTGVSDQHFEVELEEDDEYDLGVTVMQLKSSLQAITSEIIEVDRPTPA
jgi:hypothetical protein